MTVAVPAQARTDANECIHIFGELAGGMLPLCGASGENTHPECRDPLRWPGERGGWPAYADLVDSCCPTCGRPLCAFCELLFRGPS